MPRVAKTPDWTIFETFARPVQIPSWDVPLHLSEAVKGALAKQQSVFAAERRRWDSLLGELGGDPNARDWSSFRMLRRDREEDWSDWLAQLLEESHDGRFARALFSDVDGQRPLDYSVRALYREVPEDGMRSDIVIEWRSGDYTHVEVKVGDQDLAKTLETAKAMEKRFGQRCAWRADAILLLPEQVDAWARACDGVFGMRDRVRLLTWSSVSRALRQVLAQPERDSMHWRVWAHTFCGAIEQDLLGITGGAPQQTADEWARRLNLAGLRAAADVYSL